MAKKKKSKATKFYTVSGCIRDRGCLSPITCPDLFHNRKKVAEYIATEINKVIEEENAQNPDDQMDLIPPEWCRDGYCLTEIPDLELCYTVTLHKMEPVTAVVMFNQDERTVSLTTVPNKDSAHKLVARRAKEFVNSNYPDHIYSEDCEICSDEIKRQEPYIEVETTDGNFASWTTVQIPVSGKVELNV